MQTRSITCRAGVPHDLEAFNSYAEENITHDVTPKYDPNHFCPSWVKCCEENLALAPPKKRWVEALPTWRQVFTRTQWKDYITEICDHISNEQVTLGQAEELTTKEYADCRAFMHGNF